MTEPRIEPAPEDLIVVSSYEVNAVQGVSLHDLDFQYQLVVSIDGRLNNGDGQENRVAFTLSAPDAEQLAYELLRGCLTVSLHDRTYTPEFGVPE